MNFAKQKIRGWKRRVKEIERWQADYINLDTQALDENDRCYAKLWNCSLYAMRPYTLPFWYQRLIVQSLIAIYDSWKKTLDKRNEPYYLKIWLFEEDLIRSQVVASCKEMLNFYDNTFSEIEKFEVRLEEALISNVSHLSWHKGLYLISWSENELLQDLNDGLYTFEEVQAMKASAYSTERTSDDVLYLIKKSSILLGG